jgi:2Fe-2S ferredoxin
MVKITYVEFNGTAHSVEVASGENLMEGALGNGVPGIDGDCGGNAACATCHCYVPEDWMERTGARNEMEEAMLELADEARPNSRLACQIIASDALDGLVVNLPETQH